jgi:hypothetical protein
MMNSPRTFASLVKQHSYKGKKAAPLCSFSFFLGAGFPKSWDERFPLENQLFEFKYQEWNPCGRALKQFLMLNNYQTHKLDISPELFKDIVYQIGMMKKYASVRSRYLDEQNIAIVENELKALIVKKFKNTTPLYAFNQDLNKICFDAPLTGEQDTIQQLFLRLFRDSGGAERLPEGIRPHFITTNYDATIEAILDNCAGSNGSFLRYTYRGITPRQCSGENSGTAIHVHGLVNNLLKINGGFEIYETAAGYEFDYCERDFHSLKSNPPQIMLPSHEQDYQQKYFQAIFPKAIRLLQESIVLVIVGYSLPEEDALVRLMLKQFAEDRSDGYNKTVFYIDLAIDDTQIGRINEIFHHTGERKGLTVIPYTGKFSAWARAVLDALE